MKIIKIMKLTKIALLAIKGGGREMVQKLSEVLGVSEPTTYNYIATNSDNLTKAAALEVIRQETGLSDDQILVKEVATA